MDPRDWFWSYVSPLTFAFRVNCFPLRFTFFGFACAAVSSLCSTLLDVFACAVVSFVQVVGPRLERGGFVFIGHLVRRIALVNPVKIWLKSDTPAS